MADVPGAVRILPMDPAEFDGRTAEEMQSQFFLRELPSNERMGKYYYKLSGLDAGAGTVVLFQYDNRVIASAVFDRRERFDQPDGAYHGVLYFDPASIRVFDPVGPDIFREIWPGEFTVFSRVKQSLSPAAYQAFERRLINCKAPSGAFSDSPLPEEVPANGHVEGAVRTITVNRYERDPKARLACIAAHGTTCCICGFKFGARYGLVAEGYIHVHHLRPLAEAGGVRDVDPVADLRPVCPNCHAVLHLGGICRSIDEVGQMLR